mmetsp:Transcript_15137/g.23858  ORF Transcript_15137/g.23858 Transcript_15137/m.23858 type:complete len:316 (+) Transcript_15137:2-949(+)
MPVPPSSLTLKAQFLISAVFWLAFALSFHNPSGEICKSINEKQRCSTELEYFQEGQRQEAGMSSVTNLLIPNGDQNYELSAVINEGNPSSRSLLIISHGLLSTKESGTIRGLSERLSSINTCRFDFGGNGKSGGEFLYGGYEREISDMKAVISFLRENGWDVKAILGHSKAGTCVLQYGARYDDVDLIINLSGRYHLTAQAKGRFTEEQIQQLEQEGSFLWEAGGKQYPVTQQDFEERRQIDVSLVQNIKRAKVLTIHGSEDATIPVADAYEWGNLIENHSLEVIEGASHSFRPPGELDAVAEAVAAFLRDQGFE